MDIWKHSELSAIKFGGNANDYLELHKFIDSSKLFYFNVKHRAILHHTYGVELCMQMFGDVIINQENQSILVRDLAVEHIKEDLSGIVPTLKDWFDKNSDLTNPIDKINLIEDQELREFVYRPYLISGIKSSLMITFSDFGVSLVGSLLGLEKAILLRKYVDEDQTIKRILKGFRFKNRWQYTPDMKQLELLKNNKNVT